MIYNNVNDVKRIMIDITNNCQALCPGCQRTRGGTKEHPVNPTLTTGQRDWPLGGNMSFDIFKKALPVELISGDMEQVQFNGNFGEPTFHPQFKEFVQYLYDNKGPRLIIKMSTNGGLHTPEWWVDFAEMHKKFNEYPKHRSITNIITFAIDGIDDETQQKYRRGVNYDKAMANARAFADAGGNAEWQFIAFKHNEHQIEEAKKLAKEYGFSGGLSTSRTRSVFNAIDDISRREGKRQIEANETKKHQEEILIQTDKLPNNQSNEDMINLVKKAVHVDKSKTFTENIDNYVDTTEIICDWGDNKREIMVEHDGTVWQCCFFVGSYSYGHTPPDNSWRDYYVKKYLPDFNSLHSHTLEEIICESDLWKKDLHESWKNTTKATVNPRLWMCSTHCGKHRRDVEQYTIGAKH